MAVHDTLKYANERSKSIRETFRQCGDLTALAVGSPVTFLIAVAVVLLWAVSGPFFHYSDTWQLVINTGTTIITFLIVFLIQATQNRDTKILNLKLDELLRAVEGARNEFLGLGDMSEADLEDVQAQFTKMASRFGPLVSDDLALVGRELDSRRKRGAAPQASAGG